MPRFKASLMNWQRLNSLTAVDFMPDYTLRELQSMSETVTTEMVNQIADELCKLQKRVLSLRGKRTKATSRRITQ